MADFDDVQRSSAAGLDARAYQARFHALQARGVDVHGEARLVETFGPLSVLDAGCGTGRIAVELARSGIEVVGVDVSPAMVAEARRLAPEICFLEADLADLDLRRAFDAVLLAGNVPLFCPEDRRGDLVTSCAAHVKADGHLIAGFQLGRGFELEEFDRAALGAGLLIESRWSTWDRAPFVPSASYAVSILHRPG